MTISSNDILQATVFYSLPESSVMINTFHFHVGGTASVTDPAAVTGVEAWLNEVYGNLATLYRADLSAFDVSVDLLEFLNGKWLTERHVGDAVLTVDGIAVTHAMPPQIAAQCSLYPLNRKHRGRKFFGGLTEASNDEDGDVDTVTGIALAQLAADLLAEGELIGTENLPLTYVILDRTLGGFNIPYGVVMRANWGTQRRRKQFVGSEPIQAEGVV